MKQFVIPAIVWSILLSIIAAALILTGCDSIQGATVDNTEVVIDGVRYKVVEVPPASTDTANYAEGEVGAFSTRPPRTKYVVESREGVEYLVNSYDSPGNLVSLDGYWVERQGGWLYQDKPVDLPGMNSIQMYPSGGKYGVDIPPRSYTCYIQTTDGVYYLIKDRARIIPISPTTIRVTQYYIRETPADRWYYEDGGINLNKEDTKIL